jgi:Tol biopolymer transport system component
VKWSLRPGNLIPLLLLLFSAAPCFSQLGYQFGRNKVQYRAFEWKIIHTPHFDVYYYEDEAEGAHIGARLAERSYEMLSARTGHVIEEKIPLILYASHNDFQQTNAIGGLIPEGVRGVTESFKRRVVLPMGGSMRELTHVLTHELVHAFQYDLFSISATGTSLKSMPPLWVMEGLAEYYSQGFDIQTKAWLRDASLNHTLPTIGELARISDIRVYRIGNALWHYIGATYGDEAVGRVVRAIASTGSVDQAIERELGKKTEDLSKEFASFVEEKYPAEEPAGETATVVQLTKHEGFYSNLNAVPALSKDGSRIAFISDRSLYNDIYTIDLGENNEPKRLVKGARSGSLEVLRFLDTSLSWSPDGSLVSFVAKAGKKDAIYLVDSESGGVKKKITTELNGLMSPDFSPDGGRIVFSGISGGISDLYVYDLATGEIRRLTDDVYAEVDPRWSPDGSAIAFVTDRGSRTDLGKLLFGDDNIALYDLESGEIRLIVDMPTDEGSPTWIEGGRKLLFTSEREGRPVLFSWDREEQAVSLFARLSPWVSGITRYTPAVSGSDRNVAISVMERGGWDIYLLPEIAPLAAGEAVSPAPPDTGLIDELEKYNLPDSTAFAEESYHITLEPDYLVGGIGFSSNLGFQGSSQLLISDMLGNHNIILSTRAYEDVSSSDFIVAYENLGHRVNYITSFFQFRNDFGVFTAPDSVEFQSQIYRGGGVLAGYPLDTFRRIEFGASFTTVSEKIVRQSYGNFSEVDVEDLGTAKYVTGNLAFIVDNSVWGFTGPLSGRRVRYSAESSLGDLDYTTLIMDERHYFNIKRRSVVAQRTILAGSFGGTPQIFRIGGPFTFRGTDYGELSGTRILISNTEYRFPLLFFFGPEIDFLQAVFFWDMASAWEQDLHPFSQEGGFHFDDLDAAYGTGVRIGLGYLVLKLDWAWETDLNSVGRQFTFFSIGTDY